jgi:glycosyltransferase involved in cell wall biosynthesis
VCSKQPEPIDGADAPNRVSVVIPTFNRAQQLDAVLHALARQTTLPHEVIVVDDGSTDETPGLLDAWQKRSDCPFMLRTLRQTNAGPATARNAGVAAAQGQLIAFLGDDTIPETDWLAAHMQRHQQIGKQAAIVGYTTWDLRTVTVSPYLHYINEYGPQFAYRKMRADQPASFEQLYTSNLSLPRRWLIKYPFHTGFSAAMWEDTELGYRLSKAGLPIYYEPRARTLHQHPVTLPAFLDRMQTVGAHLHELIQLHPELDERFSYPKSAAARWIRITRATWKHLAPGIARLDRHHIRLPRLLYQAITAAAYFDGCDATPDNTEKHPYTVSTDKVRAR